MDGCRATAPRIPGYTLLRRVGRGGMGEVWAARQCGSGDRVAIKRMTCRNAVAVEPDDVDRMLREAAVLKELHHPHIVNLREAAQDEDGLPFLVLEWLEGQDLARRQHCAPLQHEDAVQLALQVLDALDACHRAGVVHRDIKPGNIMLRKDGCDLHAVLVDFGTAHLNDGRWKVTETGVFVGTACYVSPEIARGLETVDHRTDIFSLGMVLYELVAGRPPFAVEQTMALLLKIVREMPLRPRHVRPDVPQWLDDAVMRAIQKEPALRFESASEMARALTPNAAGPRGGPARMGDADAASSTACEEASSEVRLVTLISVEQGGAEVKQQASAAIRNQGGRALALFGERVVGLFGLHCTQGDEALRAARVGLDLAKTCRDATLYLATVRLEVGENARLNDSDLDRTFRRPPRQGSGRLFTDEATARLLGRGASVTRHNDQWEVLRLAPMARSLSGLLDLRAPPLVGREVELGALRGAAERALAQCAPELALLSGPGGIGKTRLVHELLRQLAPRTGLVLMGSMAHGRGGSPHGVIGEAILRQAGVSMGADEHQRRRALRRFLRRRVEAARLSQVLQVLTELAGQTPAATPAVGLRHGDRQSIRRRIVWALELIIRGAAESGQLSILCLEDIHAADEEGIRLLADLVRDMGDVPLLVLATTRPDLFRTHPGLVAETEAAHLELAPLSRRSLRRLLVAVLGSDVTPELEQVIARRSDGNPYFAQELISWLVAREALVQRDGTWIMARAVRNIELPVAIAGAIQGRLDRLPAEAKQLLKAASVFGELFWDTGCEALGLMDCTHWIDLLIQEGFVTQSDHSRVPGSRELGFRHTTVAEVARSMLPLTERRRLHLQVARWFEEIGHDDPYTLAEHFEQGGDPLTAAHYRARAAALALGEGKMHASLELYRASLLPGLPDTERARRMLGVARAAILLGNGTEARVALEQAKPLAEAAADGAVWLELLLLWSQLLATGAQHAMAEALIRMAQEKTVPGQPRLDFELLLGLFWAIWNQGRNDEAGPLAERLQDAAAKHALGPTCLAPAKLALATHRLATHRPYTARCLAREVVGLARESGHQVNEVAGLLLAAMCEQRLGEPDRSRQLLRQAYGIAERLRTPDSLVRVLLQRGQLELTTGRLELARDYLRDVELIARAVGDDVGRGQALARMAVALCGDPAAGARPDLAAAETAALAGLELTSQQTPWLEIEGRWALVTVRLSQRRYREALQQSRRLVHCLEQYATEQDQLPLLLVAVDAATAAGAEQLAARWLARGQQVAQHVLAELPPGEQETVRRGNPAMLRLNGLTALPPGAPCAAVQPDGAVAPASAST